MAYVTMLVAFVPMVLITVFMPYVTRRTESFGISIPEEVYHSEQLKAMRKRYAWQTVIFSILVMVAWLVLASFVSSAAVYLVAVFVFLIGSFLIYLVYHNRMKALKAKENWFAKRTQSVAVDLEFRNEKIAVSHWWFLIPFLMSLTTLVLTFVFYQQIPQKIALHYNAAGHPNRWAEKSYRTVLTMPVLQLFLSALFLFINSVIIKSKQQIDPSDPERSASRNRTFRKRWSVYNLLTGIAVVLLFAMIQLSFFVPMSSTFMSILPLVIVGCIIIGAIVLSFTTGQGGSRLNRKVTNKKGQTINRDDDRYWKLGQFYFNPDDPAIWVEKRFGVGWTVNFAHPLGWGTLVLIILLAIFLPMLTT